MRILYIDNSISRRYGFCDAVTETAMISECIVIENGREAIVKLLDDTDAPEFIVIHCQLADIKCLKLIEFIKKHERLCSAKLVVVNGRFTSSDLNVYKRSGVFSCVKDDSRTSLVSSLTKLFREHQNARANP